jgi:CDP-diacylglycerol--serine O-phosphatidyltransferase
LSDKNPDKPERKSFFASEEELPRVYLIPNLFTAGNLCFGLMAIMAIIRGTLEQTSHSEQWILVYKWSLCWILAAFICDMFDGRLARLGGRESPFGREFDSLADLVSFGIAPALLVYKIVLSEYYPKEIAGSVAFLYLLCGALRLARFNVVSAQSNGKAGKEFTGFPIPAAAGVIASITLFMLYVEETNKPIDFGKWRLLLLALMVFLSFMMFSKFKYPSFKNIDWRAKRGIPQLIVISCLLFIILLTYKWSLAIVFVSYLLYGFFRPFVPHFVRKEIDDDEEKDDVAVS